VLQQPVALGASTGADGRRKFAIGQRLQLLDETANGLVDTAAVAGSVGQIRQNVGRLQHDLQDVLVRFQLVGTNAIKRGLKHMCEGDEIIQTKGAAPPLIEWTARKTAFTVSGSRSPSFIFRRPDSSSASCSSHSWKKISLISFISIGEKSWV
jgi:hypothetical protein